MRFSILKHMRAVGSARTVSNVARDADELIRLWGEAAFDRATDLSWREDSGLTASPVAGHWWQVRREVGRRLGRKDAEPTFSVAA